MPPTPAVRPKPGTEYDEWAKSELGVDFAQTDAERLYELNVGAAVSAVQDHAFWRRLPSLLESVARKYLDDHKADLFPGDPMPELSKKKYTSVVEKTFRKNIVWNRNWPAKPRKHDWVTDQNLYSIIDDLVRTKIVCTYLDGPGLVSDALRAAAIEMQLNTTIRTLSMDEGYYAHHLYIEFPITVATRTGIRDQKINVELQITTQPQELLRHLTHFYYRAQRLKSPGDQNDWQWQFRTNKFKARYLSHALHLLEAMILDVRDNPDSEAPQEHG